MLYDKFENAKKTLESTKASDRKLKLKITMLWSNKSKEIGVFNKLSNDNYQEKAKVLNDRTQLEMNL